MRNCGQCGVIGEPVCGNCHNCELHCGCASPNIYDADELGLDPETDNTPEDESRHA